MSSVSMHGVHDGSCMQLMHDDHHIYHECNVGLSVIQPTCMQNQAVKGSQKVSITRHPIEQVFFRARLRNFAPVSRNFAPVSRDHCCTLFSFRAQKLQACNIQELQGMMFLITDKPSNCKPPPAKGLHKFASVHPGKPSWLFATSQALSFGDDPAYM